MSLRRVLVATALVVVLASSLFSGWLTASSSIFKPPIAQAANNCKLQSLAPTNPKPTAAFVTGTLLAGGYEPRDKIEFYAGKISTDGTAEGSYTCPPVAKMPLVKRDTEGHRTDLYFVFESLIQTADNYLFWFKSANTQGTYAGGIVADPLLDPPSYQDLWIVVDNNGQYALVFASAPSSTTDDVIIGTIGPGNSTLTNLAQFNQEVYSKSFNVCETDCSDKKIKEIINKPRDQSVYAAGGSEAPLYAAATKNNTFAVGADGKPVNTDAWIDYWGVKYQSGPVGTGGLLGVNSGEVACGISFLKIATSGLGEIVTNMVGCIIQYVVKSIQAPLDNYLCASAQLSTLPPGILDRARAQDSLSQHQVAQECAPAEPGHTGSLEDELAADDSIIRRIWNISLVFVNIVVVLALLAIAFANILHLNINTYTAKKALPALIIGVVGANASLLIIRFLADVTNALAIYAVDIGSNNASLIGLITVDFPRAIGRALITPLSLSLLLGPLALIIGLILIIYYFYLICIFIFTFVKRLIYLYFLIGVAPLAFVAYGVPNFQQYFTKWWELLLRFLFLYPIVLLGMALTVLLADVIGTPSFINIATVPNLFGIILVLAAASLVLKLPKIITKGTIDVADAAKKAWGLARQAPVSASGFMKNRNETYAKKMKNLYTDKSDQFKKADSKVKAWSNWRGRSNIAANPQLLKAWYDAKTKREEANTSIDTLSSKGKKILGWSPLRRFYENKDIPTPEIIKGRRAAMSEKENGALDRFKKSAAEFRGRGDPVAIAKQARQYSDRLEMFRAIRKKLGTNFNPDHMTGEQQEFIASIPQASINDIYMEKLEDVIGEDPQNPGRLPGVEAMAHVANNWAAAQETVRQMMGPKTPRAVLIRETYKAMMEGFDNYDTSTSDNRGDLPNSGLYTGPRQRGGGGGGGATPSGGPNPPNTPPGGGSPSGGSGGGSGGAPGGKVQKVFVTNPVQIQNPQNEALASQLAASAERIMGKFSLEELNNHANNAQDMGELLSGEIGDAIKGEFGSFMTAGGGDLIRHAISAYAGGGGLDAIRQKVATGEIIQQSNQSLGNQAAGFSDEQLEKLGEKISSGNAEALKEISGVLAPHIEQLSKAAGIMADPNLQTKYAQRIIDGFRQVMTQGPKSMRSYLQTNLSEFANAFVRENNIDHITPESIAKAIANNNPPPPPPPSGSGAVAPPPPAPQSPSPADGSSTPEVPPNPEEPTQQ